MNAAMPNGRCRLHGGKSYQIKGNKHAMKHGIYADGLTDEEKEIQDKIQVDDLEDEIRLCKLRIRRAMVARKEVEADLTNPSVGFEVSEVRQYQSESEKANAPEGQDKPDSSTQTRREMVRKRPDYDAIIDRYMGRLGSLLRTRAELLGATQKDPSKIASEFREAMEEIERTTLGDEDS